MQLNEIKNLDRIIELLEIEHECMLKGAHGDCDRDCANCDLVQDDWELHEMYTDVIWIMKQLKPVAPAFQLGGYPTRVTSFMLCGECNQPIARSDTFCRACGRPIDWS